MTGVMNEKLWDIPEGWEWVKVSDLGHVVSGGTPSTKNPAYWSGDVNWISPADLTGYQEKYISSGGKSITEEGLNNSSARLMPKGAVLFSSRAPVGYVAIASSELATNQGFKSIVPGRGLDSEFLYYYLKASKGLAESRASGTTFKELSGKAFSNLPVVVAPAKEQRRIVTKIEELFSELDKGVESLKTARTQLKTYRQSLLKAAFEGRLTKKWRSENADKLETADQLLQRIREAREANYSRKLEDWKEQIEVWEIEGKPGSKPKKPSIPKGSDESNTHDDLADLPSLSPCGWEWIRLGDIALESVLGKMLDKSKNKGSYKPYLRNINVRWGEFELDDILQMRFEDHETARYSLNDGDLVICEGGEPGRCAVWRKEYGDDMLIQKALHRVRFAPDCLDPEYVRYFVLHAGGMHWLDRYMTGTTIKHLTGKGLSQVPVPVCSLSEQKEITVALETKMALVEQVEETLAVNEKKLEALRQSILKRAFEGKLVPQDPDDEPASILLERIRQEQADVPKPNRRKRKTEAPA